MTINITDAVVGSVLSPTLIFYVYQLGGTIDQYGIILSADSLSSLFMMSVYGLWVDRNGNKYKPPYVATFVLGILGQLLYFSAVLLPKGTPAIYAVILARFVCGMGSAGRTLSYSYVATAVPMAQQKLILTLVSTSRTIGMAIGPFVNMALVKVYFDLHIGTLMTIPVNPNNAAGLVMATGEVFLLGVMLVFLKEPTPLPPADNTKMKHHRTSSTSSSNQWMEIAKAMCCIDLFLPPFIMTVVWVNFQTIFTGVPPVAVHALNWNPIQISYVMAGYSVAMFLGNLLVVKLSMMGVSDFTMLLIGEIGFTLCGIFIYVLWTDQVTTWGFILPAVLILFSYPWIGPANRSSYTQAIHKRKALAGAHGIMQAFLSQAMQIAGIIAPTFIASCVIRDPATIDASANKHELSTAALFGPFCSLLCIVGLFYRRSVENKDEVSKRVPAPSSETTTLLLTRHNDADDGTRTKVGPRASMIEISDTFSRASEVHRRLSTEVMGICNPFDTKTEAELRTSLLNDKVEWDTILAAEDAALE